MNRRLEALTFTPARSSDLPALRALLEDCALPTEDLHAAAVDHFVLCGAGDLLLGAVGLEPLGEVGEVGEVGLLRSLAVRPEARGQGLGHRLLDRAISDARRLGIRRLFLLTTTADALFARRGFQPLARDEVPAAIRSTTQYSAVCPSTATLMAMDLSADGGG